MFLALSPGDPQVNLGFPAFADVDKDVDAGRYQHRSCAGGCGVTATNETRRPGLLWSDNFREERNRKSHFVVSTRMLRFRWPSSPGYSVSTRSRALIPVSSLSSSFTTSHIKDSRATNGRLAESTMRRPVGQ